MTDYNDGQNTPKPENFDDELTPSDDENCTNLREAPELQDHSKQKPSDRQRRWNALSWRPAFSVRFRKKTAHTRSLFRKSIKTIRLPWKRGRPRRIVGRTPFEDQPSFVSGKGHAAACSKPCRISVSSSSGSSCSCCSSSDGERDVIIQPATVIKQKKLPPPRPPAPKLSSKKSKRGLRSQRRKKEKARNKKHASSGYSARDEVVRKPKKRIRRWDQQRRSKREKRLKAHETAKEPRLNPFDNYPAAATDRQYQDFEHDYRKTGHIFDGDTHHPHYHHVKAYPVKPARKPSEKETKLKEFKKPQELSHVGGVKYYSIKQDVDEVKKLQKKKRTSQSSSKSKYKSYHRNASRKRKKSRSNSKKRNSSE